MPSWRSHEKAAVCRLFLCWGGREGGGVASHHALQVLWKSRLWLCFGFSPDSALHVCCHQVACTLFPQHWGCSLIQHNWQPQQHLITRAAWRRERCMNKSPYCYRRDGMIWEMIRAESICGGSVNAFTSAVTFLQRKSFCCLFTIANAFQALPTGYS